MKKMFRRLNRIDCMVYTACIWTNMLLQCKPRSGNAEHCISSVNTVCHPFLDNTLGSKLNLFKFKDKYGKELRCPNTLLRVNKVNVSDVWLWGNNTLSGEKTFLPQFWKVISLQGKKCLPWVQIWAQFIQTKDVVSYRIVKTLIIKYGIYANIFAEKMWVAFAFSAKILVN